MTQPKGLDVENLEQFLEDAFAADDDEAIFIAQLRHYDPRAAEAMQRAREEEKDK